METYQNSHFNKTHHVNFFAGNLNKYKTRDELHSDLRNLFIECLGENLYIKKFNMPKFTARKEGSKYVCNPGYAFVTAKKPEMAAELIEKCSQIKAEGGKGIPLGDGSYVDIKPISAVKRVAANQQNKTNSLAKLNGMRSKSTGNFKHNRNKSDEKWLFKSDDVYDYDFTRKVEPIGDWKTFQGKILSFPDTDLTKPSISTDFPSLSKMEDFKSGIKNRSIFDDEAQPSVFNFSQEQINFSKNYLHQVSDSSSDPKSPIEAH